MTEKRKKGDRFAIITIVFVNSKSEKGAVPDLLKNFVYKEVKTTSHLEALKEILVALPITPDGVKWRNL